jgi:hypothetical protein
MLEVRQHNAEIEDDVVTLADPRVSITKVVAPSEAVTPVHPEVLPETAVTLKQVQANRENAKRSTGPKTVEGKAAVRHNAVRHGLTAKTVREEEEEEFLKLQQNTADHFPPASGYAEMLVRRLAFLWLCLQRAEQAEYPLFASNVFMFEDDAKALERIGKYTAQIEKWRRDTTHELERIQAARDGQVVHPPVARDVSTT